MTHALPARLLVTIGLLLLTACGAAGSSATKPSSPGSAATAPAPQAATTVAPRAGGAWPLLRATGGGAVTIVDGAGVASTHDEALVSADGSTAIVAEAAGDDTARSSARRRHRSDATGHDAALRARNL